MVVEKASGRDVFSGHGVGEVGQRPWDINRKDACEPESPAQRKEWPVCQPAQTEQPDEKGNSQGANSESLSRKEISHMSPDASTNVVIGFALPIESDILNDANVKVAGEKGGNDARGQNQGHSKRE